MAGSMSRGDLVADLVASLHDSASAFKGAAEADFVRHLTVAASAMATKRPRTMVGSVQLVADQAEYDVPADLHAYKHHLWGIVPKLRSHPWERDWPGRLPIAQVVELAGVRKLSLSPAPSARQIVILGAEFRFYYYAQHSIGTQAVNTTILPGDRALLLLRAQAEAMRELAIRNINKPVQLRDGQFSGPRNGTPGHLFDVLMQEWSASP